MLKIPSRKKRNQQYPFDDVSQGVSGASVLYWEDPKYGDDIPWRELAKSISKSRTQDSAALKYLVSTYRERIKNDGEDKALGEFWETVGSPPMKEPSEEEIKITQAGIKNKRLREWLSTAKPVKGLSFITDEMRKVLYWAFAGDTKAAQVIIRAYPESVYLPFIAKTLSEVLVKYKYAKVKKRDESDLDTDRSKTDFSLKDIRDLWDGFLPGRAGGNLPVANVDLSRIVRKARQQKPDDERDLYIEIGNELNVSKDLLKKKVKIKEGRGRPKNNKGM